MDSRDGRTGRNEEQLTYGQSAQGHRASDQQYQERNSGLFSKPVLFPWLLLKDSMLTLSVIHTLV